MKKLLTITALMTLPLTASAGLWSSASGMMLPESEPEEAYTIDAAGINPRVYQFTPKGEPHKTCVLVFGNTSDQSTMQMECFDKFKQGGHK